MSILQDIHLFSHENALRQIESAPFVHGYYELKFYVDQVGRPSAVPTETIGEFFLYPSGGTLRDKDMNLILYDTRFDTYKGFKHPNGCIGMRS